MSEKSKKGHPVRNTTVGVGIVAVLVLLFGPKLGFGAGAGGVIPAFNQDTSAPQAQVEQAAQTEAPVQQKPDGNLITIDNDAIYYMGKQVTIEELREQIVENAEEGVINLENGQAIKGTYDAVTSLLTELGMSVSETVK